MSDSKPSEITGSAETPKKSLWQRLKSIFNKKSAPVPPEIYKDKKIRKAVFRDRRNKRLKILFGITAASAAISTATQLFPDTVSTKFEDHLKSKQIDPSLKDHFHAQNIRVYDRWNPLVPFHLAAQMVKLQWQGSSSPVGSTLATPFAYAVGMLQGAYALLPPFHDIDAYSLAGSGPVKEREVYIRPPADFTLQEFISDFAQVKIKDIKIKSDIKELEKLLYTFVMLHEARHGDQVKFIGTTTNECDADLYALTILALKSTDPQLLQDAYDIIQNGRIMATVVGGHTDHATGISLLRMYQTPAGGYNDAAVLERLHNILNEAEKINSHAFDEDAGKGNRMIYLSMGLAMSGLLKDDPTLQAANLLFLKSALYFDDLSGNRIVDGSFNMDKLSSELLFLPYTPVLDKLPEPVKIEEKPLEFKDLWQDLPITGPTAPQPSKSA
jgi:hypothetical protein